MEPTYRGAQHSPVSTTRAPSGLNPTGLVHGGSEYVASIVVEIIDRRVTSPRFHGRRPTPIAGSTGVDRNFDRLPIEPAEDLTGGGRQPGDGSVSCGDDDL